MERPSCVPCFAGEGGPRPRLRRDVSMRKPSKAVWREDNLLCGQMARCRRGTEPRVAVLLRLLSGTLLIERDLLLRLQVTDQITDLVIAERIQQPVGHQ